MAAKQVIAILCLERTVKKGKKLTRLANDAPAPSKTTSAGMAQQIEDAYFICHTKWSAKIWSITKVLASNYRADAYSIVMSAREL